MLITNTGMIIRTRASEISVYSRTATGVRVMRLGDENMKIVSFTRVDKQEEEPEEALSEEATVIEGTQAPAEEAPAEQSEENTAESTEE
jgi:DNA gyrase subunit A